MRIYLSSTIRDFHYQDVVSKAITEAGHTAVSHEEIFRYGEDINTALRRTIATCDATILVIGRMTGDISWIEHEIENSEALQKPILIYISNEEARTEYYSTDINAFKTSLAASKLTRFFKNPAELIQSILLDLHLTQKDAASDEIDAIPSETASFSLPTIQQIDFRTILAHPEDLQKCHPRFFEELVADLLTADGWDVELVTRNNAPGPDIIAVSKKIINDFPMKLIVECKRHSHLHPVDINVVRKVMYWVNEEYRATMGMIATTSRFTNAAIEQAQNHSWRLAMKDQNAIISWLRKHSGASKKETTNC